MINDERERSLRIDIQETERSNMNDEININ